MSISTSTGTLTAGQSRTFNLSPASAVTLTFSPNVRVTITETPSTVAATGLGGNASRVHEPRLPGSFTYGPYPMGGSVVVEVASTSGSSVAWVRSDSIVAESADGSSSLVDGGGNPFIRADAYRAWLAQPKTYSLAVVPAPTHYINANTGSDANSGLTPALAWQTISPAKITALAAGSCIALSNDSLFDLSSRISFAAATSTQVNGASATSRITFTSYDPGGFPLQRPRIRCRYVPLTTDWVWDATALAWYYPNPNVRNFTWDALFRINGNWGQNYASALKTPANFPRVDYAGVSDDVNKRFYVYAPAGTNPTTYYGGAGSVILGEGEGPALNFSRSGKYVTVDNIVFEECGTGIGQASYSGTESLPDLVIQNCSFLNCGRALHANADPTSAYTSTVSLLNNKFIGIGANCIHTYFRALNWKIAGNYFKSIANSATYGGGIYAQEGTGGTAAHGNNSVFENYFEDVKFNVNGSLFDGAAVFCEQRAKGWTITRNFFAKMHVGIQINAGNAVVATHNVFDDVDCAASVFDGGATGTTSFTFLHNTCINMGLTKYRPAGSNDPAQAAIGCASNITAGSLVVRNNLFSFSNGAAAVVKPVGGIVVTATDNQVVNAAGVVFTPTTVTEFQATPAGTDFSGFGVNIGTYAPNYGVGVGAAISTLPNPLDLYGLRQVLPPKGAVSA